MNRAEYNDHRFDLLMEKVMPAPELIFENSGTGYWNNWTARATNITTLLGYLNPNALIVFYDLQHGTTQYASFIQYQSSILEVQLLDDQLQPLEARASLGYENESETWTMTITTSMLYVNPDVDMQSLSLDTFQIQDGVIGQYQLRGK